MSRLLDNLLHDIYIYICVCVCMYDYVWICIYIYIYKFNISHPDFHKLRVRSWTLTPSLLPAIVIRLVGWGLGIELHRATSSASANPQKSGGFVCSKRREVNSVVGGQCIIQLKEKKQFEHTALESTILEFWLRDARFYCYSSSWKWMSKMNWEVHLWSNGTGSVIWSFIQTHTNTT